ncbi:MAG: hypothetical protein OEM52_05425 [bacterium]|nr:hypothetical protein [bacterium]
MSDLFSLFDDLPPAPPPKPKKDKDKEAEDAPALFDLPPEQPVVAAPKPLSRTVTAEPVIPVKPDVLPPFLSQVLGQERPKQVLERLVRDDRLPHAILLYGPDGIGKQQLALELAKHLNCDWGPLTACGVCPSCRQYERLQHTSLFLAFPTKANDGEVDRKEQTEDGDTRITRRYSQKTEEEIATVVESVAKDPWVSLTVPGANSVRVITIRFLRQWAQLGTWLGKGRKVAIVAHANRMNEETANALLKILEEPPPDTLLLLLSKSPEDLLPTIQSRCQHIRMEPLPVGLLANELMKLPLSKLRRENPLSEAEALELAVLSEGSYLRAREAASDETVQRTEEAIIFLLGIVSQKNRRDLLGKIETLARGRNVDEVERFLIRLMLFLRDAVRVKQAPNGTMPSGMLVRGEDLLERLKRFVRFTEKRDLVAAIEETVSTLDLLRSPKNPQHMLLLHGLAFRLHRVLAG